MKKRKLIPMLALALVCFTIGAGAASTLQEITAYLNSGITVTLDGEAQTFLDANGNRVYPITYNGSTYLPVRAVAGLVGLDVDWDQATQTVILGKQPSGVDLIDTYKIYHSEVSNGGANAGQVQTGEGKTEDISGVVCSHWIYLNTGRWGGTDSVSYNLLGKHDTLTLSYYANNDATLTILGDNGMVLGQYPITGGAVAKTITLPLFGTQELKLESEAGESTILYIFNACLDAKG